MTYLATPETEARVRALLDAHECYCPGGRRTRDRVWPLLDVLPCVDPPPFRTHVALYAGM